MEENITMSRWNYDSLCNENRDLKKRNEELESAIEALQDNDGQKVIIRNTCRRDGKYLFETTSVKGFGEVKDEVKNLYKYDVEKGLKEVKRLKELIESFESDKKNYEELSSRALEYQMEVSRLKHRNLWQRILNK